MHCRDTKVANTSGQLVPAQVTFIILAINNYILVGNKILMSNQFRL